MKTNKKESIPHTTWEGVTCSPIKTDWHFVVTLLCIGVLGIAMCYIGKYIDMQAKRIDRLELESIEREAVLLPQQRAEQPTMFEGLGINKEGEVDE